MDAYRIAISDTWFCPACKPDGAEGPFPNGGGPADRPLFCLGCYVFLGNPLTEKGVAETRKLVVHPVYSEVADELRAFHRDVL
jgi:hypothetical protein